MTDLRAARWLRRADVLELALCRQMNRGCRRPWILELFVAVSRLGDGVIWYLLILMLPVVFGREGLVPALQMTVAAVAGVVIYKFLKSRLVRQRPFISFAGIVAGTAPLDRYSFPSGHTLHAVAFTVLAVASFPLLGWVLIPLTALIAASRVVLGLHYPSDVVAGAVLGACLAMVTRSLIPA